MVLTRLSLFGFMHFNRATKFNRPNINTRNPIYFLLSQKEQIEHSLHFLYIFHVHIQKASYF